MNKKYSFRYVNEDSIEEDLFCAICQTPFCEPVVEPSCGSMFCRGCIVEWLNAGLSHTCPTCRADVPIVTPPPRMVTNKLDALLVVCPGCNVQLERKALAGHMASCVPPPMRPPSASSSSGFLSSCVFIVVASLHTLFMPCHCILIYFFVCGCVQRQPS